MKIQNGIRMTLIGQIFTDLIFYLIIFNPLLSEQLGV
jgi:hypothetical protein